MIFKFIPVTGGAHVHIAVFWPIVDPSGNRRTERCVYLTDQDRCTVYAIRPLMCRVYGLLKQLSCPRGCNPAAWLTASAFVRIAQAVEAVGGGRLLVTTPDGLARHPGGDFATFDLSLGRPTDLVEADVERTRSLRALHGGRILAVVKHE